MALSRNEQCELDPTTQDAISVDQNTTSLLSNNPNRRMLIIQNIGATNEVYIGIGHTAAEADGILLKPEVGTIVLDQKCPTDSVNAICATGETTTVYVAEYE